MPTTGGQPTAVGALRTKFHRQPLRLALSVGLVTTGSWPAIANPGRVGFLCKNTTVPFTWVWALQVSRGAGGGQGGLVVIQAPCRRRNEPRATNGGGVKGNASVLPFFSFLLNYVQVPSRYTGGLDACLVTTIFCFHPRHATTHTILSPSGHPAFLHSFSLAGHHVICCSGLAYL